MPAHDFIVYNDINALQQGAVTMFFLAEEKKEGPETRSKALVYQCNPLHWSTMNEMYEQCKKNPDLKRSGFF